GCRQLRFFEVPQVARDIDRKPGTPQCPCDGLACKWAVIDDQDPPRAHRPSSRFMISRILSSRLFNRIGLSMNNFAPAALASRRAESPPPDTAMIGKFGMSSFVRTAVITPAPSSTGR